MEMYSASQVLEAVEPCRFECLASGQQRSPLVQRTSSHSPEVLLAVSMSLARSASGDMTILQSILSDARSEPWSETSALCSTYCINR
eukprot:8800736-Heterocapsa_arctica.AAC.1